MATLRCLCGHAKSQHYVDRKGRPQCVHPCACQQYRPRDGEAPAGAGRRPPRPTPTGLDAALRTATGSFTTWMLAAAVACFLICRFLDATRPLGVLLLTVAHGHVQ